MAAAADNPSSRFGLRAAGFLLDVFVVTLAVCSAATWAFYLWIDLRFAGFIVYHALPALWALSVLLVVVLLRRKASVAVIRALCWPTYLILICALANTVYFYRLWNSDRIDVTFPFLGHLIPPLPLCIWIGIPLGVWAVLAPKRVAISQKKLPKFRWPAKIAAGFYMLFCSALVIFSFWVNTYETPPAEPVDVAVVLGNRVMPDGTASVTLEERTLAAVDLYHRKMVRKILVSGMIEQLPHGNMQSEALAMKKVCLKNNVPEEDILVDPVGVNTRATVFNAREIMRDNNLQTVVGVSDAFHLPRIKMTFAQAGMSCSTVASKPRDWVQADAGETLRELAGLIMYATNPSYRPAKVLQMNVVNPRIVVTKSLRKLELFDGDKLVKTYPCTTGKADGDKNIEGDLKTPEGAFHIVFKNPKSDFHLSLGLNYPNAEDAERGLAAGLVTKEEHDKIIKYSRMNDLSDEGIQKFYWHTALGGEIFIHGESPSKGGTLGCVKVSNPDIEELYAICRNGTPVEIKP